MVTNMVLFIALLATLATSVLATEFIVGDDYGWTLNFDYQAWAKGKEFVVGDKLVFKYPVGKHNVFKVDGNGFKGCVVPAANESLASGYDVVTLTTPGKKWYICGVGKHCETGGMKLVIDVLSWSPVPWIPVPTPSPSPNPVSSGKVFIVGDDYGWTLNFDYQAWAKGKEFFVGDKLVFKYPVGKHNVFKVDGNGFRECVVPVANESLATGYDVVTLTTPGKKWYICGVGKHCATGGMKLVIDVLSWSPVPWIPVPTPSPAPSVGPSGKVFIVGDDYGWTLNFDYQAWAKGKEFVVGDKLIFKYPVGKHNVFKVDGNGFKECVVPTSNESLASGYDVVTLTTPGKKWYICGVGKHCETGGMKLVINVLSWLPVPWVPVSTPSPAPTPVMSGKVFIVGDESGWTLNFDYQAWTKGKEFVVGDKLVFKYPVGTHNVYKVNGTAFQQCVIPVSSVPLSSGYDVVTLTTPGKKWYICGVGNHCKTGGMKLVIDVLPQSTYSFPPSPSGPYNGARRLGNSRVLGRVA